MTGRCITLTRSVVFLAAVAIAQSATAIDSIQVEDVITDSPTICCLGFSVQVSGDDDYDAVASIEFREAETGSWATGLPLLRVRREFTSQETTPGQYGLPDPAEQFAGSLFGLAEDTAYEVRITVTDPDGGDRVQTITATTRSLPRSDPLMPRFVSVANTSELNSAISTAQAGDVSSHARATARARSRYGPWRTVAAGA